MKKMILCKEYTFDAAHKLDDYAGKCGNLHGHTYKVQVCIKGDVQKNGLVMDFKDFKGIVSKKIIEVLDHKYINDIIKNPSVENVCIWAWDQLKDSIPLYEIRLWETPTTFAIYSGK